MEIALRDYQRECVTRVLAAYDANPHDTKLLVLPCGAGKTVIFSHVINVLNTLHGLNTLIIAHRDDLLDQAAEKYRLVKPDAVIGKVGSGCLQYGGEVTVASVATISRPEHIKKLKAIGYGLVIVDEAHHVASEGYQRVLKALPDAFTLMVTATPDRLDNKPILEDKEPLYSASITTMIRDGYLCNFKSIAIKTHMSLNDINSRMGDFNQDQLACAVDTPTRNQLIVAKYQEFTPGKRAVAFCVTVAHAEHLAAAFNAAGIKAEIVEGHTPFEERKAIYARFHDGETLVMTNVMVLSEGWDEPLCEVGIGARPTQSRALHTQQFGRILRLAPGKSIATWLDITDNCKKHSLCAPGMLFHVMMKQNESFLEAEEREKAEKAEKKEREKAEKEARIRKLKESRVQDEIIGGLWEQLPWEERADGVCVLTFGVDKHRIALSPNGDGTYSVWGKLFPAYESQLWLSHQPLPVAQEYAEQEIRKILVNPKAAKWADRSHPGQREPATKNQIKFLDWKHIPYNTETLTKGQASKLIDVWKAQDAVKKAMAKAKKEANTQQ